MSDLLTRMTERTLGLAPSLQPKLTSTYESSPGDGLAAAYAPNVMGDFGAALATDPAGTMAQTNTVVIPRSSVPVPIVVAAQQNLVISRLSHNLSGAVWQDAPSPVTALNPMTMPITTPDLPVPEMIVTPAVTPGITNLSINSPALLPSQPVSLEFSGEIAEPLAMGDLVPQSSDPFPITTNPAVSEPRELITKSELITTRENLTPIAPSFLSSPLPIGIPVNLVAAPAANQPNLTSVIPSGTSEAIESSLPIPPRERLITEISTVSPIVSPVATSQSLVSVPDRKAIQTLVPITVRPIDRSPVPQISPQPAPTIQVKIGRIEIRAVTTPPPAAPPKSRPNNSVPQLSLADYLKSRGSST